MTDAPLFTSARPCTRWWWFSGPIDEAVIRQQLAWAAPVCPSAWCSARRSRAASPRRRTQRERWLDLLYTVSTDATTVGASRHLLYIGRKPNPHPHPTTHNKHHA